jgi:tetratricopeptide (TPR) repeat protein/transglutaminase-like putative cysteine protease
MIAVLLLVFAHAAAQQIPPPGAPEPGSPTPASPAKESSQAPGAQAPIPPDYSQQAFVVEQFRQSARFEDDGTGREEQEARVRIVSESGVQALGQMKVGYSALSDQLEIVYVRVRKPDGTVVTAQDSAIQDLTIPDAPVYTDYHQKHISVPSLRPGDTLEYRYVRTIVNPLIPGQFWTSYNFSEHGIVLDEQVEINIPKNREVKLKTRSGFEPKITDEGDRRVYRWTHSHSKDDEAPLKRSRSAEADEPPAIQLTTFQSWEQLGDWYRSLESDRRQPTEAVKAKADALVQGKTDDMAKVKALYEYVSRDFRYVSLSLGLGRYQPHAAAEVMSVGYGDCKDKNTLLASLLQAEGFESTSVLINARRDIDPEVPSPSQFDHVITRVPVAGQEIWLDSTSGIVPFRMVPFSLRDKEALAVPPAGKPSLVRTPAELPFTAYDHSRIDGALTDTGKLSAHFSTSVRGDQELALRYVLRQVPSNRWKDFIQSALRSSPMRGGEITNLRVGDPSDTDMPLQIDYDIVVSNYFDWSAADPKLPMPIGNLQLPPPGDTGDGNKPIKLGPSQNVQANFTVTLPSKYTAALPIGVDLKRDYVEYHSSYKMLNNQLIGNRDLTILTPQIPSARAEDWGAFRRVLESDQAQVIRLENKAPGIAGLSGATSAKELFDSGTQALNNHDYELALELLQKLENTDPNYKGLWTALGRAYLATDQDQKAVEAFQKQIASNAYDQSAYNELGLAYERQQKYPDAIAQFNRQIEINPLDGGAHANLGLLYMNLKRFAEAVPELEKAVSIQPNNPVLLVALGQAYIATGQLQRGMASIDKAITTAPSPLVWNNAAYALAEQNQDLKRADGYADAAINALETQLRDASLASLRFQDLMTSLMLFNVWDTKGWVLFKSGDPDKAEAYILPAWQATGSGATAEHLGEIAEMRGAREQAVRYYSMSLATDSPSIAARDKLAALGITGDALQASIAKARKEMASERTVKMNAIQKGTAEYFLLISPGKIEDIKFVKGEESLRAFTDMLKTVDVPMKFPPSSQGHVIRRVRVSCGSTPEKPKAKQGKAQTTGTTQPEAGSQLPGPCTLEWIPANQVRGIN